MKRITTLLLVLISIFAFVNPILATVDGDVIDVTVIPNVSTNDMELETQGVVLMALDNGEVLFSKDAEKQLFPASTTKILTALLAIENGDLEEIVTVGNEANLCTYDSSKAGIDINEEISLKNLLYGLMLPSGNDAAYTIAVYIGRKVKNDSSLSIDEALKVFIGLMNSRARKLGATRSNFVTPDGYHDDDHYTTAYDMALITREAMTHDALREIVGTTMFTIPDWSSLHDPEAEEKETRYWKNTNALIQPNDKHYYPYATGGKTGYTSQSKHCLVTIALRDGMELITVLLGSTSKDGKWIETTMLLDYGFDNFVKYQPFNLGQQVDILDITGNPEPDWVRVVVDKAPAYYISKDQLAKARQEIQWNDDIIPSIEGETNGVSLPAPIARGQRVGSVTIRLGNKVLDKIELVASKAVEIKEEKAHFPPIRLRNGINSSLFTLWSSLNLWQKSGMGALILVLIFIILRANNVRRKRRYVFRRRF